MINAAICGLGRWGQALVTAVQGTSNRIRFVRGVVRDPAQAREAVQVSSHPVRGREVYDQWRQGGSHVMGFPQLCVTAALLAAVALSPSATATRSGVLNVASSG